MLRKYRASLNIDFTKQKPNGYQKLIAALIKSGWRYVETSALILDTDDLGAIWGGLELVVKQCEHAGELSALTFHVQGSSDFGGISYRSSAMKRADPDAEIRELPWPKPKP